MPLHYTKSGSLDMRYSSSRAAVSSGSGGGSYGGGGGGSRSGASSSSYYSPTSSSGGGGYHYTKDGSLDMRYSSSKAAVSSGGGSSHRSSGGQSSSSSSYSPASSGRELHFKKDGSLDMRYSSSRAEVAPGWLSPSQHYTPASTSGHGGDDGLHYKKDGSLDMRYSTSKAAISSGSSLATPRSSDTSGGSFSRSFFADGLHHKKDGSLDMRYSTSKAAAGLTKGMGRLDISSSNIPKHVPVTKKGRPDMRTKEGKEFVKQEVYNMGTDGSYPSWVPRKKDGSLDLHTPVGRQIADQQSQILRYDENCRQNYYDALLRDLIFQRVVEQQRFETVAYPKLETLPDSASIRRDLTKCWSSTAGATDGFLLSAATSLPTNIPQLNYKMLEATFGEELGRGGFGTVCKAKWNNNDVAIKCLHLNKLTKKIQVSFLNELRILSHLGKHENLVSIVGYTLEPPSLVMEYVELGSLHNVMHYCTDKKVEAKMTDGRIKKRILLGVANGMMQLHVVNVVHGDLKPHNVLISKDFAAKITDFGLAVLRCKTSTSTPSSSFDGADHVFGGTAGYMAPELVDSSNPPELSSDVYSFGILFNEVIQEEEPYAADLMKFHGRGVFAAANYAKLGNRPRIGSRTPWNVKQLIEKCWNKDPSCRPVFATIFDELDMMELPNAV